MEELKHTLIKNIKEYYQNALNTEKNKQYNSAVTLFFKTLSSLCDLFILIKEGHMPTSHTERFRILQTKYPKICTIIDKDFPYY